MGRHDDQGAGLGVGRGLMVLEGNAQMIADMIKFCGINVPGLAGQLHRAAKGYPGWVQARNLTALL